MSEFAQELIHAMPSTMGACLVGSYLSSVLFGVTLLQTYQYYSKYHGEDKRYLPILVAVLTVLDTFAVIANMNSIWFYLIKNFANPIAILNIDWSLTISVVITAVVGFLVQMFYAYRAYILGKKRLIIPSLIILFALLSLAFVIWYMSLLYTNGSLLYIPSVTYISTTSLACGLAADLLIASSISIYLMQGRQQGMRPTNNLIRKLVIYTISTGAITSACTALTLILGVTRSHTFYNTIFYFPLSKCYVNSMLAFLNTRESLRQTQSSHISYELSTRVTDGSAQTAQASNPHISSEKNVVTVQYDTATFADDSRGEKSEGKVGSNV